MLNGRIFFLFVYLSVCLYAFMIASFLFWQLLSSYEQFVLVHLRKSVPSSEHKPVVQDSSISFMTVCTYIHDIYFRWLLRKFCARMKAFPEQECHICDFGRSKQMQYTDSITELTPHVRIYFRITI